MLRFSAVIPCYNGERWLAEAIDSVRAQTRSVHEIIVVDDGSTDRSGEIAGSYSGVHVIEHGRNRGAGAARNSAIHGATGDAIAWLDADDMWRPNHVEVVGGLLERNPDAVAAFGAVQRFGLSDRLIVGYVPLTRVPEEALIHAFHDWLHTTIAGIVRRPAVLAIGGFDEADRYAEDFDLWLRLAHDHRFVATDQVTADSRWHDAQQSATPQRQLAAVYRYRRRFLDRLVSNGEHTLAAALEEEFRAIWLDDLNAALDTRDQRTFREVASRAHLLTDLSPKRRVLVAAAAHVPIRLVTGARNARRAIRRTSMP